MAPCLPAGSEPVFGAPTASAFSRGFSQSVCRAVVGRTRPVLLTPPVHARLPHPEGLALKRGACVELCP